MTFSLFYTRKWVRTSLDKIPTQHIPPPWNSPSNLVLRGPNPLLKVIKTVMCPIPHGFVRECKRALTIHALVYISAKYL